MINIMKKIFGILVAVAGLCSFNGNAQSKVLELPDFNSGKTVWIVRVGVDFNSATGDWKDMQRDAWEKSHKIDLIKSDFPGSTGFDVTVGFNKSFGAMPLYWGMDLGIATRGYKSAAEWYSGKVSSTFGDYIGHRIKEDVSLTAYNVNFTPFKLGYKYTFLKRMAVDVHLGGFVSFDFAGTYKIDNYDWQTSSGQPRTKEESTSVSIGDLDKYRRFDAGLNLGIGYWYGHFNIDLTWQKGFINMYDMDNSMKSQALKLSIGYAF